MPLILENVKIRVFLNLKGDFTRISNRVDIEDIEDDADQRSLRTTSNHVLQGRAATTESAEHFFVLKVTCHQFENTRKPFG